MMRISIWKWTSSQSSRDKREVDGCRNFPSESTFIVCRTHDVVPTTTRMLEAFNNIFHIVFHNSSPFLSLWRVANKFHFKIDWRFYLSTILAFCTHHEWKIEFVWILHSGDMQRELGAAMYIQQNAQFHISELHRERYYHNY